MPFQVLERDDRLTLEPRIGGHVRLNHGEGDDFMFGVMRQVEMGQRGEVSQAEDDHAGHRLASR
jgi:hypothetical protein